MRLTELAAALPSVLCLIGDDADVSGIVADSRLAQPGSLFVAVPGVSVDGHRFAADAVARGATAVAGEMPIGQLPGLPMSPGNFSYLQVGDSRVAWGWLCAAWHGFPSRLMTLVGVTGTDGKTTTVNLIDSMLTASGSSPGMISTVNARIGNVEVDTGLHVTTPDAPEIQSHLARMVQAGATHAVLEVTSHGLAQHRVAGCEFDVAVVTNITHEHVDAHGSFEAYREAKASLFEGLTLSFRKPGVPKVAVINLDDSSAERLEGIPADRHITYSLRQQADVTAGRIRLAPAGTRFVLSAEGGEVEVEAPLAGLFNVSNVLAAAAAGLGLGIGMQDIRRGIMAMRGVPGRLERIDKGQDYLAIVDFAHTPNAMRQVLQAARTMTGMEGRVIVVFGSAGLRDPEKRAMMGREAGRLADLVVITAEDPRTEDLQSIMADIVAGAAAEGKSEGTDVWRIADRGEAILFACRLAQEGDVVLACGKGHEQSMCFGTVEYPWDDREAMRLALDGRSLSTLPTATPRTGKPR